MKDIRKVLRSVGLNESEIKTYIAALEGGAQTVLELSKKTGLSRQATYVAIDALMKHVLMTTTQQGKRNFYMAEHPEKLLAFAKRRESEIKEQIRDLEHIVPMLELQLGGEKPVVKMYEGKEGIRAIIEETSESKSNELYEMTDGDAMYNTLTVEDLAPYREGLTKHNITVYGIYGGKVILERADKLKTKHCVMPQEDWNFKSHLHVSGDRVALITFTGKMHSIVIESKPIADAMRILMKYARKSFKK